MTGIATNGEEDDDRDDDESMGVWDGVERVLGWAWGTPCWPNVLSPHMYREP